MIENFNMEYNDVIQYLNSLVVKKSERLNIIFKYKTSTEEDINKCSKVVNDIINFVNKKISVNQFNQYSTNISSFDGFEKVQRELGLPVSLYKKFNYNREIKLVNFSLIDSFYGKIKRYKENLDCYFYKVNVSISRDKINSDDFSILNFNIDFVNLNNLHTNSNIIYNININGNFSNSKNEELYLSSNKNNYSNLQDTLSMNQNLFDEVKGKRDIQNEIMQSSIDEFF